MATQIDSLTTEAARHPLEPLGPEEIRLAARLVREKLSGEGMRFESILLNEPDKQAYRALTPGKSLPRVAIVNAFRAGDIGVWQFKVALDTQTVVDEAFYEAARPMIMLEEFMAIEDVVKADPQFQAACTARGIEDIAMVCVDPWSAGNFGVEGRHLAHTFCWLRTEENDNLYAHPIEGLNAVVDIKRMTVLRVDDYGAMPVPRENSNYESQFQTRLRDDLKPINITQPEGVSFSLEGPRLRWHDWDVVIGFNAREGLTLHDARHGDRSVLYRASLAEMVVPYGSPKAPHYRKNVSTSVSTGSASSPTHSALAVTASASSSTSTPGFPGSMASPSGSRMPSASTKRTTGCSGSTGTSAPIERKFAARASW
jgi:primary-amine oxidase